MRRSSALGIIVVIAGAGAVSRPLLAQSPPPRLTWTLDEVIERAIAEHPSVQAAEARVDAARGARRTAGTWPNPTATYWVEQGATGAGATSAASPVVDFTRETQTYFAFPLEPLFQRGPRVQRADEVVKTAQADVQAARRQVTMDAARLFFRIALAQASLEAAQENRTALDQLVVYNRARVSQGVVAEVDLMRAQVELDRTASSITLSQVELIRSQAELWAFLGLPADAPVGFAVTMPGPASVGGLAALAEYVARAREQRAEVAAARARAAAATADIAYQRRQGVRQVGATIGFKRTLGENTFLGGLTVPIPLFDQNRGEVQRATADSLAAQKELALAERTVAAEVRGAYAAAQQLSAQVANLGGGLVDRAREADRITLAAYQQGAATLLQVIDTARALSDTRLTYSRLVLAQRQSVLELALSVGNEPSALGIPVSSQPPADGGGRP